jgi:hypothetical protein
MARGDGRMKSIFRRFRNSGGLLALGAAILFGNWPIRFSFGDGNSLPAVTLERSGH